MTVTKSYLYVILFDKGSAEIRQGETTGVDQGIWRWPSLPEHRVEVTGHGISWLENKSLALARAEAVHSYLVDHGVDDTRIDELIATVEPPPIEHHLRVDARHVFVRFYNARLEAERKKRLTL